MDELHLLPEISIYRMEVPSGASVLRSISTFFMLSYQSISHNCVANVSFSFAHKFMPSATHLFILSSATSLTHRLATHKTKNTKEGTTDIISRCQHCLQHKSQVPHLRHMHACTHLHDE